MKPFITIKAIRDYYLYSLVPKESEFKMMFGYRWMEFYKEAVNNPIRPSLTGFIKHWREQVKSDYFDIVYKRRNG